jgi:RND superfamily putative drug exporter
VQNAARQLAEQHYVAPSKGPDGRPRFVTRLDVVFATDPFDAASVESLDLIETWLGELLPAQAAAAVGPVTAECFGVTVHTRDMANIVAKDRVRVNALVVGGVFLILLAIVRKVWLAGYLLGTVLLSYYATLGATALFTMWTTGRPFGQVEWRVPFFLFTILVAVGEDYNILLVTRILQERFKHGPRDAIRRGLAATGGTITACGLIMAGTFGTLMLADLGTLKQVGFALGVGVLLDTFVVRPFLVPSFMQMVGDAAEAPATPMRQVAVRVLPRLMQRANG